MINLKPALESPRLFRYHCCVILCLLLAQLVPVQVAGLWNISGIWNMVLVDTTSGKFLLIGVSQEQAAALQQGLSGLPTPRPMTHDLFLQTLDSTGWSVSRVVINQLKNDVFYARLILKGHGKRLSLDARPSDALNIAVRAPCPVFVEKSVLESFYQELRKAIQAPTPVQTI